jgi:hypothetical protein
LHYVSHVLDHTGLMASEALKDLIKRLGLDDLFFKRLHLWSDCGPHFRCYEMVWTAVDITKNMNFEEAVLHYSCEHHGKGRNDGQFGLQRHWSESYAKTHTVSTLDEYIKCLEAGALHTMRGDPPPAGPEYCIVKFDRPKPLHIFKLDTKPTTLSIEYTYCLSILKRPTAESGVAIFDFTYSDRLPQRHLGRHIGGVQVLKLPSGELSWRSAYRNTTPEQEPLNLALLTRRLEKQRACKTIATDRHMPAFMKLALSEKDVLHRKAKRMRMSRASARDLESASSGVVQSDSSCDS